MSEGHTYGARDTEHTPPCTGHCLGNLKHISCHPPKQAQHWVLFAPSLEKPEAEGLGDNHLALVPIPCDGLSIARKSPHHGSGFLAWVRLGACPVPPVTVSMSPAAFIGKALMCRQAMKCWAHEVRLHPPDPGA